jgi:hypothetical protein
VEARDVRVTFDQVDALSGLTLDAPAMSLNGRGPSAVAASIGMKQLVTTVGE